MIVRRVANKSAKSRCNGIWETTRHNKHNVRFSPPTFYRVVVDLLRESYGETDGVIDFGLTEVPRYRNRLLHDF